MTGSGSRDQSPGPGYRSSRFFKCEIEKLKSSKKIKREFLSKNFFVYYNTLSNTYVI